MSSADSIVDIEAAGDTGAPKALKWSRVINYSMVQRTITTQVMDHETDHNRNCDSDYEFMIHDLYFWGYYERRDSDCEVPTKSFFDF